MEITIKIETCKDCRHLGHSGAFTPGGPKLICNHPYAPITVGDYKHLDEEKRYYWKHRTVKDCIPIWCPLKNGYQY